VLILPSDCASFPAPSDALPAKLGPNYQRRNSVQDLIPWPGLARWSQRLQDWVEQLLERHFGTEKELEQPTPSEQRSSAPVIPKSELAQFPGLVFDTSGASLDDRAVVNDDAIRAGLIWFKHRWPSELAVIDGSEEFRRRAWEIADEVGVPLKGPRPGSREIARHVRR
jgi:Large polyvalent protein-associated domain 7